MNTPAEILVFGAGEYVFYPSDYPWATELLVTAAGGAASDGTPGTAESRRFRAADLPQRLRIHCGRGGRDQRGRRGQDGYVIIELYP